MMLSIINVGGRMFDLVDRSCLHSVAPTRTVHRHGPRHNQRTPQTLHRNRCTRRISSMNPEPDLSSDTAASVEAGSECRHRRILNMTAALRAIVGDAAVAIADGQPGTFDVGGRSGIQWQDLADELRAAKLPRTVTFTPTP